MFLLEVNQKYKFKLMACAKSKPKLRPKPVKRNDADSTYHEAFLKEGMFFFLYKKAKRKAVQGASHCATEDVMKVWAKASIPNPTCLKKYVVK